MTTGNTREDVAGDSPNQGASSSLQSPAYLVIEGNSISFEAKFNDSAKERITGVCTEFFMDTQFKRRIPNWAGNVKLQLLHFVMPHNLGKRPS